MNKQERDAARRMETPEHINDVRGWIAPTVEVILNALTFPGILILSSPKNPASIPKVEHLARYRARALRVDTFVAVCLLLELTSLYYIAVTPDLLLRRIAIGFVAWRIVDVVATSIRVSVFDEFDKGLEQYVHSAPIRVVVLGLLNYFELVICFAALYVIEPGLLVASNTDLNWWLDERIERGLHFSWMTQLTVGYGDFYPNSWVRPLSWLQSFSGLSILALLIARYMSALPHGSNEPT